MIKHVNDNEQRRRQIYDNNIMYRGMMKCRDVK